MVLSILVHLHAFYQFTKITTTPLPRPNETCYAQALYQLDQQLFDYMELVNQLFFLVSGTYYVGKGKRRFTWKCRNWWGLQRECRWWYWAETGCWGLLWFLLVLFQREIEELPVKNVYICLVSTSFQALCKCKYFIIIINKTLILIS